MNDRKSGVIFDEAELRDYQRDLLVPFLLENRYSGAFVDMGLGKTVSILTVLDYLFSRNLTSKALIVAPLRVAVQTWPTEIKLWSHTWWMTHTLIRPDPKLAPDRKLLQKKRLAREKTQIHIINREQVKWLVEFWGPSWPYKTVIIDESRSFADQNSQRWKALNKVCKYIDRMHLLSGIPAPEGIEDYFAQVYLLDRGERFGKSITDFRKKYLDINKYTYEKTPKEEAEEEVASKIADICIVMREEDYLKTDKPIVIERPIILDQHEMNRYEQLERSSILSLPDDVEIEAETGAALGQKLMQYASGAVYDENKAIHIVHDHKLEEILQLRSECDSPIMVAYWHRSSLTRLQKLLPKALKMDKEGACVADWNAGKIDSLLVHPASVGHGLNMQKGPGHTLIFFDNPWPLELYLQLIKRLARSGQKKVVRVYHLTTMGTVDERVVPALRNKDDAQDAVRRYIRDARKRYGKSDDS